MPASTGSCPMAGTSRGPPGTQLVSRVESSDEHGALHWRERGDASLQRETQGQTSLLLTADTVAHLCSEARKQTDTNFGGDTGHPLSSGPPSRGVGKRAGPGLFLPKSVSRKMSPQRGKCPTSTPIHRLQSFLTLHPPSTLGHPDPPQQGGLFTPRPQH